MKSMLLKKVLMQIKQEFDLKYERLVFEMIFIDKFDLIDVEQKSKTNILKQQLYQSTQFGDSSILRGFRTPIGVFFLYPEGLLFQRFIYSEGSLFRNSE